MAVSVRALADKGRGRAARPSPLRALVVAAVVGLGLARFLLATPDVAQPPPLRPATTAEALALLRESVVSDPADSAAWLELGLTLVQAASETGDPSFYPQAENALNAAKALAREDAASRVGLAVLALARHDFHAAESAASDLVADDPFNAQALVVLVDAEIELGRYESAGDHLQQLLDVRPALPALAHTSYLRELHGDLTGAEQAMVQALTAGSRSPFDRAITTALLGDLYLKRGDLNRAEESYLEAERLIPGLLGARIGRARVLTAAGDLEAAAEVLEQVVARFPEPGALTQLGEVLTQLGRPDEARNAFDTVAVITDLQTEAGAIVDLELARFAANHGDPKAARVLAAEAYRNRPTVFAAQVLAWAMHRSGDSASALPLAEEALRLGTADASLHLQAAEILGANGQATRARQLRSAARQWDPWFHVLHPELAR